ncbi:sigma-70 family RNA polymerase sigma factor [Nonomuraea deserti]|uniref:Sigma-70 family RNA polymerase sigma factor n=1 Tax=Nonomuraea deserti TaxID=1848322 RepID=A0A4R4VG58_9ACTN|nr:sigma-70 family RNA polymerase sigma factor [Nonomuraea deserti]TDD01124.1 sigma-70 family RNA polymerase sigma factor [Nonomuraea deserti]
MTHDPFHTHRNLLYSLAHDILGSVGDAEDVVQETWLRWHGVDRDRVDNPRAYLVRVATRLALNARDRLHREYAGPWLPEPVPDPAGDPAEDVARAQAVAYGLMVVLETLSPLERAAFILFEAFGFQHREIARILDRSPAAVRQLVHRAREHVQARRPRFPEERAAAQAVAERFLDAALGGSIAGLMEVLAPDVTLRTDGGGRVRAALRPVTGSDRVSRLLVRVAPIDAELTVRWSTGDGPPTAAVFADGRPYAVLVTVTSEDGHHISEVYGVLNPDKLARLAG